MFGLRVLGFGSSVLRLGLGVFGFGAWGFWVWGLWFLGLVRVFGLGG